MCDILVPLTANAQRIGTEEERKLLDQSIQLCQRLLIEVTLSEATKLVGRGTIRFVDFKRTANSRKAEYEDALPGAIQALRFSLEIYGSGRSELIPCYILLAEANLGTSYFHCCDTSINEISGLSRFKQAEECLCNANWILIKTRDNDKKVKSILYRGFGRLYAAQGKREDSLRQLANDVGTGFLYGVVFRCNDACRCIIRLCEWAQSTSTHLADIFTWPACSRIWEKLIVLFRYLTRYQV